MLALGMNVTPGTTPLARANSRGCLWFPLAAPSLPKPDSESKIPAWIAGVFRDGSRSKVSGFVPNPKPQQKMNTPKAHS